MAENIQNKTINCINYLLQACHESKSVIDYKVPLNIQSINQLNSKVLIFLFENICNSELTEKRESKTINDEIHNIQLIIDSLSNEILQEDLSHLNSNAIFQEILNSNENLNSLEFLIDILKSIHEWISSRMNSVCTQQANEISQQIKEDIINDDDETASFENYTQIKEKSQEGMERNSLWQEHLNQLETFDRLHQELETHYLSSSDLSSANTSAFSYKQPASLGNAIIKDSRTKVVTFPDQSQLSDNKENSISRHSNIVNNGNSKSSQPKFVKLNNRLPPANYMPKSFIRSESKQQSTKNQMNPVDKYQEYKKFWSKQKVPGESDHSNLRWWIREKMREKPKIIIKNSSSQIKRQEWVD